MRLLTRADMDGIACAVLLTEIMDISAIVWVEPQVLKNGGVQVDRGDIIANLPLDPRCGLWFDHHISNRPPEGQEVPGAFALADSAARVIFDHYQDPRLERHRELLVATDRIDAAKLTLDDVLAPEGYILVGLTVDPRSGLDNSDAYFHALVGWLREDPLDVLLQRPEVQWRCEKILADQERYKAFLLERSWVDGRVIVTDMRGATPPAGNRFLIYTLFPDADVAVKIHDATDLPDKVALSIGHSIFRRTCEVNVGELLARYGGGGHRGAGSSRIDPAAVDGILAEILTALR